MECRTAGRPAVIHTPRLSLRPFCEEDAAEMTELLTDRCVSKTYMLPEFTCREEAQALFERLLLLSHKQEHFIYGIYREGALAGFLNDVEITDDAIEVGYVIAPAFQNKGYATEALGACVRTLFGLGFRRVIAGYFYENTASRRVMEKCGMRPAFRTAEIMYRGEKKRCVFYEISAEEKTDREP